ncbi:MAG: hypothetical protein LBF89_08370, partial [Bacteroidales bacterium]|nr:hypothetical protein [Bacteroidales bacterium]
MRKLSCVIMFLGWSWAIYGQSTITLNSSYSGNQTFVATDWIKMIPGFSYTASSGSVFIASIGNGNTLDGDTRENPIIVTANGTAQFAGNFIYTNTVNTANFTNAYTGRSTNDVFFQFTLTQKMEIIIKLCDSSIDTYLWLLDFSGLPVTQDADGNSVSSYNDDYSGEDHCGNTLHSYMKRKLNAGTYYAVVEGYNQNGSIKFSIEGVTINIVSPAEYQSIPPDNDRTLNTSYAVGTTSGIADVSSTGAATYGIPIEILPGTAGVQPGLSVVYNSQSGNGLLGYGWNLSGLSAVIRCGKTYYHDGAAESVKLTTADNLAFDGQRLLLVSGTHFSSGAKYRTELESFNDVTYKSINSKMCFEVKTKEGWTLEYGSTDNSYIEASGVTTALYWLLAKATDPSGNYMTYTYAKDNTTKEFRLIRIDYTGNMELSPYNCVEFFYQARSDVQTGYVAGSQLRQSILLKSIKVSTGGSVFREYKFKYCFDGLYSKLTEI